MQTSFHTKSLLAGLALCAASLASAQQTVPIFGLVELSGTGATAGSNLVWKVVCMVGVSWSCS